MGYWSERGFKETKEWFVTLSIMILIAVWILSAFHISIYILQAFNYSLTSSLFCALLFSIALPPAIMFLMLIDYRDWKRKK